MTPQEIFDRVSRHLLTQKRQAFDDMAGRCSYVTHDGLKCAVGCLIPDEHYHPALEGLTVTARCERMDILLTSLGVRESLDLLKMLQDVHDLIEVCDWKVSLQEIGLGANLNIAVLEEFA
jgi:hypothetical protein